MKSNPLITFLNIAFVTSLIGDDSAFGKLEILDRRMNDFFDSDTSIEILATGFTWSEGPVWVPKLNGVLFSDVPENRAYLWTKKLGLEVFLDPSGYTGYTTNIKKGGSNGLALDQKGNLILCQQGDRRIAMFNQWESKSPKFETIVDRFETKRFSSPNDLVISKDGSIFFTDPPYGLKGKGKDSLKELDYNGVYKWSPNGCVTLINGELTRPNGIELSLDEKTLYVANSDRTYPVIVALDLTNGDHKKSLFFDGSNLVKEGKGLFDGLKMHSSGVIFATGPGGVLLIDNNGKHLGTILTKNRTANCVFDGEENYLYMTADSVLARVRLK